MRRSISDICNIFLHTDTRLRTPGAGIIFLAFTGKEWRITMEQKGELVSFRPDIKVVDCTLRDGGLVNNFEFSEDFVRDLYKANVAAGVDYMEFGYKASKEVFKVEDYGKWKFCDEKDIRAIVGDNDTDLKISVMADVGRADYKKEIIHKT